MRADLLHAHNFSGRQSLPAGILTPLCPRYALPNVQSPPHSASSSAGAPPVMLLPMQRCGEVGSVLERLGLTPEQVSWLERERLDVKRAVLLLCSLALRRGV